MTHVPRNRRPVHRCSEGGRKLFHEGELCEERENFQLSPSFPDQETSEAFQRAMLLKLDEHLRARRPVPGAPITKEEVWAHYERWKRVPAAKRNGRT